MVGLTKNVYAAGVGIYEQSGRQFITTMASNTEDSKSYIDRLFSDFLAPFDIWNDDGQNRDIIDIIQLAVTTATTLAGIVAVAYLIRYGGYEYIMSAGNQEQAKKAMDAIRNSVIGLIIILAAYIIIAQVLSVITG